METNLLEFRTLEFQQQHYSKEFLVILGEKLNF